MSAWQPIDTAPKDGANILVWRDGEQHVARWFQWGGPDSGEWGISPPVPEGQIRTYAGIGPRYGLSGPTLWRPLPESPEAAG
jgi:hypothetical protein